MQLITIAGREADASRGGEALLKAEALVDLGLARWLAAAAEGDANACFDLGVAYSTGSNGAECDLIEAHKWFNLAAARGHEEAAHCRADISDDMTAREIAEAQRRARQWLAQERLRAA
jgi:TPR repeat protein